MKSINIIVWALLVLTYIAYGFFLIRYFKRETTKSAIGWAITSATVCVLEIILFSIEEFDVLKVQAIVNFYIYAINFGLAIYGITRCKNTSSN